MAWMEYTAYESDRRQKNVLRLDSIIEIIKFSEVHASLSFSRY